VLSLGGGIEYGITNWLSAAIEWDPGWNVWSDYDFTTSPSNMLTVNGSYDIFAGVEVQVLGEKGLLASRSIRLTLTPEGIIPLPSPDWEEQLTRRSNGESWVLQPNDHHTPALGGRASFDYVLKRMFFFNLYGEFLYYFPKAFEEAELLAYLTPTYEKVDYGY
jgi:hypothetical protein